MRGDLSPFFSGCRSTDSDELIAKPEGLSGCWEGTWGGLKSLITRWCYGLLPLGPQLFLPSLPPQGLDSEFISKYHSYVEIQAIGGEGTLRIPAMRVSTTSCARDGGCAFSLRGAYSFSSQPPEGNGVISFSTLQTRTQGPQELKQLARVQSRQGPLRASPRRRLGNRARETQGRGLPRGVAAARDPSGDRSPNIGTFVYGRPQRNNSFVADGLNPREKKKERLLKLLVTSAEKSWNFRFVLGDFHNHRSRVYTENVWPRL